MPRGTHGGARRTRGAPEAGTDAAAGVRTALDLYEIAESLVRQRDRRERPGASEAEIEELVLQWRLARPGAEDGDAPGRPRPLPQ